MSGPNGKTGAKRWDTNAEASILGAVLLRNEALDKVPLAPDDFHDPRHREVWRAMLSLARKRKGIDPVLLEAELGEDITRAVGGLPFLSDLVRLVPTADNVEFYVALVRDTAITRRIHLAASALLHSGLEGPDLAAKARELLRDVAPAPAEQSAAVPPAPTAAEVLRSSAFAQPQSTWATGFGKLDELLDGGIKARQLTCLAASTGAGKTAFACELSRRLCMERPILYVSTEIEPEELAARVAGPLVGARASEILALRVDPREAAVAVDGWPIHLLEFDTDVAGLPEIAANAEALRNSEGHAPIIVVDYLQHLANAADDGELRVTVKRIATGLRRLARTLDTAVIAISSVGRGFYGPGSRKMLADEEDPRAWLAAAKESGDIEYSTAVFMFLETDSHVGVTGESHARLIVAKSRRGMHGFVGLKFHGPTGRFYDSDAALTEMGPQRKIAELERNILALIKNAPQPLVGNDVVAKIGGKRVQVLDAIKRLTAAGQLVTLEMRRPDANGRPRKVSGLALGQSQPALNLVLEDTNEAT